MNNALLLAIHRPGTVDRGGDVSATGTMTWQGRVGAYLRRERRRAVTGEGMTLVEADTVFVRHPSAALVAAVPGDQATGWTVLLEDRRTGTPVRRRFRVVGAQHSAAGTVADSLRLELDDERAA